MKWNMERINGRFAPRNLHRLSCDAPTSRGRRPKVIGCKTVIFRQINKANPLSKNRVNPRVLAMS